MSTYYDQFLNEGWGAVARGVNQSVNHSSNNGHNQDSDVGNLIVAGVLAYGVIKGAHHIWKNYISTSGRQCSHLSGELKEKCIEKMKIMANGAFITEINKHKANCSKTNDPQKCIKMLDNEVEKYKQKALRGK